MMARFGIWRIGLAIFVLTLFVCLNVSAEERYTVKPGDTLAGISKSKGVSVETLKKANGITKDVITPRQVLRIPSETESQPAASAQKVSNKTVRKTPAGTEKKDSEEKESYTVQKGDTLNLISKRVGMSTAEIMKRNNLSSSSLRIGQVLALRKAVKEERTEDGEDADDVLEPVSQEMIQKPEEKQENSAHVAKWSSSEERNLFVKVAKTFLGVPYRLGGSTLKGLDCSAYVKKIYEIFNIDLPRTTREQFRFGKGVKKNELEEGDLVFFNTRRANGTHVGIYIGNNEFVHASSRKREVKVDNLDMPYFNKSFLRGVRVKEMEGDS
jgi:peptidoglycan DL-endopeptidase LytE